MANNKQTKFEKWRQNSAALVIALLCLFTAVINWDENWIMTGVLLAVSSYAERLRFLM